MVFGKADNSNKYKIGQYGSVDQASETGKPSIPNEHKFLEVDINSGNMINGLCNSNSSSSSSRSSILADEMEAGGFVPSDTYQRQLLIEPCGSDRIYQDGGISNSNGMVKIAMPCPHRDETRFPKEKCKTLIGFGFLFLNWIFTTASLALTHERVPEIAPLPDITLDNINVQRWGLEASEIMIIISVYVCVLVVFFHKHRFIIFRRLFLIMGLLYFYRSITMYVTVLPVADEKYYCSPKANTTSFILVMKRVVRLLSGFGLSMNGQHTFCGDYIYSGHTVCLVMAYLIVREYTPRRWWPLHWLFALFAALGVVFVLIARGHYTVDVVIAYYITTRLFYIYHTLANNQHLQDNSTSNYFERLWWYPIFTYFESNVQGVVPRHYEWPLPWPRRWGAKKPQRTY